MAYHIHPRCAPAVVTPANGKTFTLEEMQKLVDGYIEIIPSADRHFVLVINEEGKFRGMQLNVAATNMATKMLMPGDHVVGPAVIATRTEAGFNPESEAT